jgi:nicotinamidase-related amidase
MTSTALLVMDLQQGVVSRFADDPGYLTRVAAAVARIHPAVGPAAGDVIVSKRRVSAFAGSDLDLVLRSGGVEHLVLAGIATSGVVLSTVRQAADLDYRLTVLSDGCLDGDPEVHRVLTEKVFPRQAEVTTVAHWTARLG